MLLGALMAGVGGLLPTLARIAASFASNPDQPLPQWHILIALGIFFVLGSVIDIVVDRGRDLRQAVIIGIAAPGLITNIVAGAATFAEPVAVPAQHAAIRAPDRLIAPLEQPATAALALAPPPALSRRLVVRVAVDGTPTGAVDLTVGALSGGRQIVLGQAAPGEDARFDLPADATAIVVADGGLTASAAPPPVGNAALRATVRFGTSGRGDLYWALGGQRSSAVTSIALEPVTLPD